MAPLLCPPPPHPSTPTYSYASGPPDPSAALGLRCLWRVLPGPGAAGRRGAAGSQRAGEVRCAWGPLRRVPIPTLLAPHTCRPPARPSDCTGLLLIACCTLSLPISRAGGRQRPCSWRCATSRGSSGRWHTQRPPLSDVNSQPAASHTASRAGRVIGSASSGSCPAATQRLG